MRSKAMIILLVVLFAMFLAGGAISSLAAEQPAAPPKAAAPPEAEKPKPVEYNRVGTPLPPIALKKIGGGEVDLSKIGKPSMLMFVNSTCVACRGEMTSFSDMSRQLKGKLDVYIVSVDFDADQSFERIQRAVKLENFTGLLADPEFKAGNMLGFNFTPGTVVSDANGIQTFRKGGFSTGDENVIVQEVMKVVKGK